HIIHSIRLPASHRNGGGAEVVLASHHPAAGRGERGPGKQDELRRLSAIQRQFRDALLIDHLGYGVLPRLHHAGGGRDFHVFRHGAHLHGHIQLNVVAHLQYDPRLRVALETARIHFQTIWSDREVREHIASLSIRNGAAHHLFVGLGDFDSSSWYRGARG